MTIDRDKLAYPLCLARAVKGMKQHYGVDMPDEEYEGLNACAAESDRLLPLDPGGEIRLVHLDLPSGKQIWVSVFWHLDLERVIDVRRLPPFIKQEQGAGA